MYNCKRKGGKEGREGKRGSVIFRDRLNNDTSLRDDASRNEEFSRRETNFVRFSRAMIQNHPARSAYLAVSHEDYSRVRSGFLAVARCGSIY